MAATSPWGADVHGDKFDEASEYAGAVRMLMFLDSNARHESAFTTHQCGRFTHAPQISHALAIKHTAW